MTDKHAWFNSEDAQAKPSNVIHLPKIDRTLPNGWKASEMKLYCRLISEDRKDG